MNAADRADFRLVTAWTVAGCIVAMAISLALHLDPALAMIG
jgi:hypothetical protein